MDASNNEYINNIILSMANNLKKFRVVNNKRRSYYDGKTPVKDLRIGSIPKGMQHIKAPVGWGRLVIDVIAERVKLIGFNADDESGIEAVLNTDANAQEIDIAIWESFLYGKGFLSLTAGDKSAGEAEVVLVAESANYTTTYENRRTRRTEYALTIEEMGSTHAIAWFHDKQFSVPILINGDNVSIDEGREVIQHGYGFVPVFCINNRPTTSDNRAKSEISDSVMFYVDAATRTLLEMEVSRSLYANGRIVFTGLTTNMMEDTSVLERSQRAAIALPHGSADNANPDAKTLSGESPSVFGDILRTLAVKVSAETAIPVYRISATDANPASADAILASDVPLNSKCSAKIRALIPQLRQIGKAILLLLGVDPTHDKFNQWSEPVFAEPSTLIAPTNIPTITELIREGVLQPDSDIVLQRIGLDRHQAAVVNYENRVAESAAFNRLLMKAAIDEDNIEEESEDLND